MESAMIRHPSLYCVGSTAIVFRTSLRELESSSRASFHREEGLRFCDEYISFQYGQKWCIMGPLNNEVYRPGYKCTVGCILTHKDPSSFTTCLDVQQMPPGGGAFNNARVISRLAPNLSIACLFGIGHGLKHESFSQWLAGNSNISVWHEWSYPPIYLEIDLAPMIPERIVFRPDLKLSFESLTPIVPPSTVLAINSIHHPWFLARAAQAMTQCNRNIVTLTGPLQRATHLIDRSNELYRDLREDNFQNEIQLNSTMNHILELGSTIVMNQVELLQFVQNTTGKISLGGAINSIVSEASQWLDVRLVITLGALGALLYCNDGILHHCYLLPEATMDRDLNTYGLGDAFVAWLILVEVLEAILQETFEPEAILIGAVATGTAALQYGYNEISANDLSTVIQSDWLRYSSTNITTSTRLLNALEESYSTGDWKRLRSLPSRHVKKCDWRLLTRIETWLQDLT